MTTTILALHQGFDPAAAIVRGGAVLAYSEEERHSRVKHAPNAFPAAAIRSCLDICGLGPGDVDRIAYNWDLDAYTDGRMRSFYEFMRESFPVDPGTIAWQERILREKSRDRFRADLAFQWQRAFGGTALPEIVSFPHHYTHAYQAFRQSGFDEALCLTIDGSGDSQCTVVWKCRGSKPELLRELQMPHSLGWLYAAMTEYLGFEAYDGEYKVMGMASYGGPNAEIQQLLSRIIQLDPEGGGYRVDPTFIHYGPHSYSSRYTDKLVELFGAPPRHSAQEITQWHKNLAYCVQERLEAAVLGLVKWGVKETGLRKVCISGGVGLNVKMNSKIFQLEEVDDVFAHPLCSDNGAACGAGLLASEALDNAVPEKLRTLALGHAESPESVRRALRDTKTPHQEVSREELPRRVARALADGKLVGWFQGRMEAGPRALGNRSILSDPRNIQARDRVNAVIKYREPWRPFCPSIISEAMPHYFDEYTYSPFMIIAFNANDRLKREAPAIVHVDGTSRVQQVMADDNPLYHQCISEFGKLTGTPVLLNTSFNVKGEPIVCTALDALRTFFSTGLDILAIENFMIEKRPSP